MFEPRAQAATFTVTNTSDGGPGSLREAINNASLTPEIADTIGFNIRPPIRGTSNIGINLDGRDQGSFINAVTPNDPCDADEGMNGLQNFPVIKSAVISGNSVSIAGTLNSIPGGTYRLEFFASRAGI